MLVVLDYYCKLGCLQYRFEDYCHAIQGVWDLERLYPVIKVYVVLFDLIIILYLVPHSVKRC